MHTIKITPNLLFEYQRTSGKFIRLPNRIEKKIDLVARIESNRNFFLPELECPSRQVVVAAETEFARGTLQRQPGGIRTALDRRSRVSPGASHRRYG